MAKKPRQDEIISFAKAAQEERRESLSTIDPAEQLIGNCPANHVLSEDHGGYLRYQKILLAWTMGSHCRSLSL